MRYPRTATPAGGSSLVPFVVSNLGLLAGKRTEGPVSGAIPAL
jgi:hypothetical protein